MREQPSSSTGSRRYPARAGSNSWQSEDVDLARDHWIPLASTAVFLLLSAVCVSLAGGFAVRFVEPTPTSITATVMVSPTSPVLPTATEMVIPTPTTSTTPVPVLLKVLPSTVNLRAAPSTTARIMGQIKKDIQVRAIARSEDGKWFLVINPGNEATLWVSGPLLETMSGDPMTLPMVATTSP